MPSKGILKICKKGHRYYKSSNCPTCPVCEQERKPDTGFLSLFAAPARRALEGNGLTTSKKLSLKSEATLLTLHGMGPSAIKTIRAALKREGLSLRAPKKKY